MITLYLLTENTPYYFEAGMPIGWLLIIAILATMASIALIRATANLIVKKEIPKEFCPSCRTADPEFLISGLDWREYVCHNCQEIFVIHDNGRVKIKHLEEV